jgi:hypothetical protein
MRLAGVRTLEEATAKLVNTRDIDHLVASEDDYADVKPRPRPWKL